MNNNSDPSRPPLDEKNFIQDGYSKDPFPMWIWLAVVAAVFSVLWGSTNFFSSNSVATAPNSPFMQVSNRQISLFLWQFPEYMRANVPVKEGYLPGFNYQEGKVSIVPAEADKTAIAPPDVLFLYHTWARLLKNDNPIRTVSLDVFKEFIQEMPEWLPQNWPEAPQSYKKLIEQLESLSAEQFTEQYRITPLDLQIAVTGWLNYFKEGAEIERASITYREIEDFLNRYPDYSRPLWRNILLYSRPDYLLSFSKGGYYPAAPIQPLELVGFLKVAFFNYKKTEGS